MCQRNQEKTGLPSKSVYILKENPTYSLWILNLNKENPSTVQAHERHDRNLY
jgi:hypothetical protein